MNAPRQAKVVARILSTGDDALMRPALPMKAFEIRMVMGKYGALIGAGVRENNSIVNALTGAPRVLACPHIVPEAAKFIDYRQGENPHPHRAWP